MLVNMALSLLVSEIVNVDRYRNLENHGQGSIEVIENVTIQ